MKIFGFICIIMGIICLVLSYLVAADRVKPSKATQVILYITVALSMFGSAFNAFTRALANQ